MSRTILASFTILCLLSTTSVLIINTINASEITYFSQTYGGSNNDGARSIVHTTDGGYALAGTTSSFGASDDDFWLVKTDANGAHVWNQTYGGPERDYAYSVVQTVDGGYALAGNTRSFGAGNSDFWFLKTDQHGFIPEFPTWTLIFLVAIIIVVVVISTITIVRVRSRKV